MTKSIELTTDTSRSAVRLDPERVVVQQVFGDLPMRPFDGSRLRG
jgi:hypothetical protein